jgi:enoyl-CoA hydratase/carnithine racemase
VRIASTTARFAWNFVRRGLIADTGAGTFLLPRIIGHTEALRLLYSGEFLGADRALQLGFASAVVEPGDLLAAARAEAERFLAGSPFAVSRTKRLVYDAMAGDVAAHDARTAAALRECFASDDHREGVASFLERREAHFTGT